MEKGAAGKNIVGNKIGLYLHIPFCIQKCRYCDFLSFPGEREERKAYVRALVQEMKMWRERLSGCEVDTIFLGGGTPSVLEPSEMSQVFEGIEKYFTLTEEMEFTVECNPGTVSEEKFRLYREAGVNRLSFGMQSARDKELKKLGRIHSFSEFVNSYRQAREFGFSNINVDIMSAIPGQSAASYEESLEKVIALSPEHISSYSLIIEEGTPFYEEYGESPPVDEETDRAMYERTGEMLAGAGYERYEISNYAREGKQCRHNLKYWRRGEYLGLGLGAASLWSHCRFSNERDFSGYLRQTEAGKLPVAEWETLTKAVEKSEFMYLGLRCMQGVSKAEFTRCFGEALEDCFGDALQKCLANGLLEQKGDWVCLTKRGIDVSNRVFAEFV